MVLFLSIYKIYYDYLSKLNKNIDDVHIEQINPREEFNDLETVIYQSILAQEGKYMVLAEKDGDKLYLISEGSILWDTKVEGKISGVNVNRNGYVSVIIQNTIYKSV